MKKILITGAGSYIGTSLMRWLIRYPDEYQVDELDMREDGWRVKDFSPYDVIFHVAGLAHADIGSVSEEIKEQYYRVNCDLTAETAWKAKGEGVKQFIFMSSIIVYGSSGHIGENKVITRETVPAPENFYGDSKLKAENKILPLAEKDFTVTVLRPPMIYGKDSKGNYSLLAKLACKLPVFPDIKNERSMLYIDNLCEYVRFVIDTGQEGVLFPQNREYGSTTDIVKVIAQAHGKKIWTTRILNWGVFLLGRTSGKMGQMINKAFGNMVYAPNIDITNVESEYNIQTLKNSILITEGAVSVSKPQRILILVNHDLVIYNFRKEVLKKFLEENYEVYISSPNGERIEELKMLGCYYIQTDMERHGINPFKDFLLLQQYYWLVKKINPLVVLTYTIKPNIYGGISSRWNQIPCIANITGLGNAIENKGVLKYFIKYLYSFAFKDIHCVFFQNSANMKFFKTNNITLKNAMLLPGSGVNTEEYELLEYSANNIIKFYFVARLMKEKGIEEYLEAAKILSSRYSDVEFHICGFDDGNYKETVEDYQRAGILTYHGMVMDMKRIYKDMSCVIVPSYHEGMSNVILEAASSGRPVIASDIPGCREAIVNNKTGFLFKRKNVQDLVAKTETFIHLSQEQKKKMGLEGRKKMLMEFSRDIVIEKYMQEIKKITNKEK